MVEFKVVNRLDELKNPSGHNIWIELLLCPYGAIHEVCNGDYQWKD